jgi:Cu-Zn family superoxide dismutase
MLAATRAVTLSRTRSTMALWAMGSLALASCQTSTQVPPPGETPSAVSPVVPAVPAQAAVPTAPAVAAPAADMPATPPATRTPQEIATASSAAAALPGAIKVKSLATTTRAQCAIVGLGKHKGQVKGSLLLSELPDGGVKIDGVITGLTPGKHGFHVHEHGNCASVDGASAGGHFNPTRAPHGDTEATDSHVGDLGNIEANAQGKAIVSIVKKPAVLKKGPSSFLGKAFIVHGGADDLTSQPAGDAGGRIGCGVIKPVT